MNQIASHVETASPELEIMPRIRLPTVPGLLAVDSSDTEKVRAYANLAIVLNQALPQLVELVETQAGMITATNGLVSSLSSKVDSLDATLRQSMQASVEAVKRGKQIAAAPSLPPPPPEKLDLGEEMPTFTGEHVRMRSDVLASIRVKWDQQELEKRSALAAVEILKADSAAKTKELRDKYTVYGIVAAPTLMLAFYIIEHVAFK